jgi:hypothetical protein
MDSPSLMHACMHVYVGCDETARVWIYLSLGFGTKKMSSFFRTQVSGLPDFCAHVQHTKTWKIYKTTTTYMK